MLRKSNRYLIMYSTMGPHPFRSLISKPGIPKLMTAILHLGHVPICSEVLDNRFSSIFFEFVGSACWW